jgi:hypothetical protein
VSLDAHERAALREVRDDLNALEYLTRCASESTDAPLREASLRAAARLLNHVYDATVEVLGEEA